MTRFLLLTLALMCENVNAAPQATTPASASVDGKSVGAAPFMLASDMPPFKVPCGECNSGAERATTSSCAGATSAPPFTIADPMCNTGFTISQRLDTRNAAGTIIKSVWVRKCTMSPRIVFAK